jgi:hypothetical protein
MHVRYVQENRICDGNPSQLWQVLQNPYAPRRAAADVYAFGVVLLEIMQVRVAPETAWQLQLQAD